MLLYIAPSESMVPVLSPCPVGRSAKEEGREITVYRIAVTPRELNKNVILWQVQRTILVNQALNDLGFKCMWSNSVKKLQPWTCCF